MVTINILALLDHIPTVAALIGGTLHVHWLCYNVNAPSTTITNGRTNLSGLSVGVSTVDGCHGTSW